MTTIDIGVVGCGMQGRDLVRRLVKCDPRLNIAALFDPDPKAIETLQKELPDHKPVVCADYSEMLTMPNLQWVMIASWNCRHCEQTTAAFEAGKHVFCQKPLALTVDECVEMLTAWKKSGKLFNIGFTLRYSPHYRKIHEILRSGKIGKIVSMEFNETLDFNHGGYIMGDWRRLRENAGTHLLEKCCHDIDLAAWMVGSKASRVASFGGLDFFLPKNASRIDAIGKGKYGETAYMGWVGPDARNPFTCDKDIIDNQVVIMEYENGVRATFHTNCNAGIPERRMYILGSEGALRADVLTGKIEVRRIGFDAELEDMSTSGKGGHGGGDNVMARELADSMLDGAEPSATLTDGLIAAVTCFAIDDAMDSGRVVALQSYWDKVSA